MADTDELRHRIALLVERERYDEARRLLADLFSRDPDDSGGRLLAARVGIESRDRDYAEEHLEAVLARDPGDPEARVLKFRLLSEAEQYVEAEQVITGLLREYPEQAHFYGLYARLMLQTLHVDKARALAREGLRLDPADHLSRMAGLLVDVIEDRSGDAARRLEQLVREDPEALHVAWGVALVLQSRHRYAEALQVVRGILRVAPGDPDVVAALVDLRMLSHWSMLPLAPLQRYGWGGSGVLWGLAVLSVFLANRFAPDVTGPLVAFYLAYVIYSWVWPPLLKRWVRWRGF